MTKNFINSETSMPIDWLGSKYVTSSGFKIFVSECIDPYLIVVVGSYSAASYDLRTDEIKVVYNDGYFPI